MPDPDPKGRIVTGQCICNPYGETGGDAPRPAPNCPYHNPDPKVTVPSDEEIHDESMRLLFLEAVIAEPFYQALCQVRDRTQEATLREMDDARFLLWMRHGCPIGSLYGDDGEMQCGHCLIDFKRTPMHEIREIFQRRGMEELRRAAEEARK